MADSGNRSAFQFGSADVNRESHADPEGKDARHPKTKEDAILSVDEKPQTGTRQRTDERVEREQVVQFFQHNARV